ncbi:MAG: hypothetical protein ACYDCN_03990 [Bacteroidia bacterium]
MINIQKKYQTFNILFGVFILLIIANHIALYFLLNFNYIDTDQPIMWLGTEDFSKGIFHVPRFYGQNYNTMLEALLAVPFYYLGIPVYTCVPMVTHLLALFPFVFISGYLFLNNKKSQALIVLLILLCLPTGYDIINSIPRGFVTGIFFTSYFVISLHQPKKHKYVLINSFLAYIAFLVNPNSILISVPCLFYLWLQNYTNKRFYAYVFIGLIAALPFDYGLNHFYKVHPNYIVHGGDSDFSFTYFMDAITHLNDRFAHISPFADQQSITLLILLAILLLVFYKKNKKLFYSLLVLIFIVLISFSYSKTQDGTTWPFYSYSRMYIGIPIVIVLFISLLEINFSKLFYFFVGLTLLFSCFKFATLSKNIKYHTQEKKWDHLQLISLADMKEYVNKFKILANENHVNDLIMVELYWRQDFIIYGGPALISDYPNTLNPHYDRRTWRMQEEDTLIKKSFIILCGKNDYFETHKIPSGKLTRINEWGVFLVTENTLTTIDFLRKSGFNVIPFKD